MAIRRLLKKMFGGGEPLGRIPGVLVAGGLVGSGYIIGLNLLFQYHNTPAPKPLPDWFYPAIPVFPICALLLVRSIIASSGRPRVDFAVFDPFRLQERRRARQARNITEDAKRRADRLAAVRATRKYAQQIRAGVQWTDEAIAYDMDPNKLASCAHLQPIERAMRQAGITVRLRGFGYIDVQCCIDPVTLSEQFDATPPVRYYTMPGDRQYDPWSAVINCQEHQLSIVVVVPEDAPPGTPWFPGPPRAAQS